MTILYTLQFVPSAGMWFASALLCTLEAGSSSVRVPGRGPGIGLVLRVVLSTVSPLLATVALAQNAPPPGVLQPPSAPALSGPAPVYTIPRATSPIRVDGVIDEDAWKSALRLDLPYEIEPGENIPAPVRTEVLLIYDGGGLHAAFRAYDPDPSEIRAHLADRDQAADDDWVALFLDTFNDERRGFELFVNPFGRSEEHTSELQSPCNLVCRLLLEKKKKTYIITVLR